MSTKKKAKKQRATKKRAKKGGKCRTIRVPLHELPAGARLADGSYIKRVDVGARYVVIHSSDGSTYVGKKSATVKVRTCS